MAGLGADSQRNSEVPGVENEPAETLSSRIGAWTRSHPDQTILLVIDQAEEMVTLCRDKEQRQGFIGQLVEAIHAHRDRFRVVLSLRSDYEPQVRDSGFASAFGSGAVQMLRPTTTGSGAGSSCHR